MRLAVPFTLVRTRWMFGFHRRLVRTWECETLLPKLGCLPQTSQVAATVVLLNLLLAHDLVIAVWFIRADSNGRQARAGNLSRIPDDGHLTQPAGGRPASRGRTA